MKTLKKHIFIYCLFTTLMGLSLSAQNSDETIKGSISFISSQHIYVKFVSTEGITVGDTLYVENNGRLKPAVLVQELSSISCLGTALGGNTLSLTNKLTAKTRTEVPLEVIAESSVEGISVNDKAIQDAKVKKDTIENKSSVDGRISISSYTNVENAIYNSVYKNTLNSRLRYNLSLNAKNIANSKLSLENYMSYTHLLFDTKEKFEDLRIYNLALNYAFNASTLLSVGRKINTNMANVGAVDGIQFEKGFKNLSFGLLAGFRPNDSTYGFDSKLFQYGGFIGHQLSNKNGNMQTSVAFFNQTNEMKTDRRYLYLQHSNALLKNVDLFASAEIDLYKLVNAVPTNEMELTSTYLSLSYRPVRNLSFSLSYDARKNVYYYETYKNKIDSTLENAMRQGLRFRFNYRPFKFFSWGGNAGYRLQTPSAHESMNATSYLNFSKIPWIDASLTLTGTALQTVNVSGFIYGGLLSKEFFDGNFSTEIEYRKAQIFEQDIAEISFLWRMSKSFILSANFEGTFETGRNSGRAFINLSKRF